MKRILLLLVCVAALLWVACEEEAPDYVGTWEDDTTLAAAATTVTFDLDADEGTILIDKTVGDDILIEGNLDKSGSTLTATITQITVGSNPPLTGAGLDAYLVGLGLTTANDFTYSVAGDTLTITGDLIFALTTGFTDTLVATRI